MNRWIAKQQILNLIKDKSFASEDDFRDHLSPRLATLFGVKSSQVDVEANTTSFDRTLSNRVDIVVRTDDNFRKAIVVIELKLTKSVEKFKNGDYQEAVKQLHKYSQDTRAPYGILLTEVSCAIYKNKYFSYDQKPKREKTDRIPSIDRMEDTMALYALFDFLLYKKSVKYALILLLGFSLYFTFIKTVIATYGFIASMIVAFIIVTITVLVILLLSFAFKIFD
jgi:hypothetical protein